MFLLIFFLNCLFLFSLLKFIVLFLILCVIILLLFQFYCFWKTNNNCSRYHNSNSKVRSNSAVISAFKKNALMLPQPHWIFCYLFTFLPRSRKTIAHKKFKTFIFIEKCLINILNQTVFKSNRYFKGNLRLKPVKLFHWHKFYMIKNCEY